MPVIPVINKDISMLSKEVNDRIQEPKHQRNLVLIIVCIALLLDNMLYMVIVPIIPQFIEELEAGNQAKATSIATMPVTTSTSFIPLPPLPRMPIPKSAASKSKTTSAKPSNNDNDDDNNNDDADAADKNFDDDDDDDNNNNNNNEGGGGGGGGGSNVKKKTTPQTTTKKPSIGRAKTQPPSVKKPTPEAVTLPPQPSEPPPIELVSKKPQVKDEEDKERDVAVGYLFASKAFVQLFVNPFSGAFIDRIGYDIPMCIGLTVIFLSTLTFSFGNSYAMLLIARSLQGVGSAFADTSGLAMIADRFTEEGERSKALGIALAFISFGSLVAPPFGGFLCEYMGRSVPFILLALIALFDGGLLFFVMRPHRMAMTLQQDQQFKPKGTPIWRLFQDPYIAVCSGALVMANVSLAFLEPTIAIWMEDTMGSSESQIGLVWLPGFIPHLLGVVFTVWMSKKYPQYQWVLAAAGLALEGVSCFLIPFCTNYYAIMIPISGICFGIALIDTAILPTLAYLVDVRHTSVYGSIYAIADISYSLAYAFGPVVAGKIVSTFGFTALNIGICFCTLAYTPALFFLRYFYEFKPLESNELSAISNAQSAVGGAGFKRFRNDDGDDDATNNGQFNTDYTSIDTGMMAGAGGYQQQQPQFAGRAGMSAAAQKPQSAAFQNMQKYPKKQSKNPYKDTHNLIDNMDEDE